MPGRKGSTAERWLANASHASGAYDEGAALTSRGQWGTSGNVRRVAVFVSMLVVLLVVALLLVWVFQRRLIYLPDTGPVPSAAGELAGARDVHLSTIDGLRLGAWYLPAASAGR